MQLFICVFFNATKKVNAWLKKVDWIFKVQQMCLSRKLRNITWSIVHNLYSVPRFCCFLLHLNRVLCRYMCNYGMHLIYVIPVIVVCLDTYPVCRIYVKTGMTIRLCISKMLSMYQTFIILQMNIVKKYLRHWRSAWAYYYNYYVSSSGLLYKYW